MRRIILLSLLPLVAALLFFLASAPTPLMSIIFAHGGSGGPSVPEFTATPTPDSSGSAGPCVATHPVFLTLVSKHKEVEHAFGNPVDVASSDDDYQTVMNTFLSRAHKDPALAGTLTTMFDPDGDPSKIDNATSYFLEDHEAWCDETNRAYDIAWKAYTGIVDVDAGMHTLYMVKSPNGIAPVSVREGVTTQDGQAAEFKWTNSEGHTQRLLLGLDCGLQPMQDSHFPGVAPMPKPKSDSDTATPSPESTSSDQAEATPQPVQSSATHRPTCKYGRNDAGNCKKSPDQDQGHPGNGGGGQDVGTVTPSPRPTRTDPPQETPDPVQGH